MKKVSFKNNFLGIISVLVISTSLFQAIAPLLSYAQIVQPPKSIQQPQIVLPAPGGIKVNTWNGNAFYSIGLVGLSGRGLPVNLALSYNSSWAKNDSAYGFGWQFGYNIYYTDKSNGDIIVTWGDGRSETFTNNNGTYVSSADTFDTLTQYETGKFKLVMKDGVEYYFNNSGIKKISTMRDQYGNVVTFQHNPEGQLTGIVDASNRLLLLNYTGGKLTQIVDNNVTPARVVNIDYDGSGNLEQIRDFKNNPIVYTYNSEHSLIKIKDIAQTTTNISYSNGIIASIVNDAGPAMYASYDSVNKITKIIQNSNNSTLYVTKYFYDAEGRISKIDRIKDGNGVALSQFYTWDSNNNLLTYKDEKGNVTTNTYDSKGNILNITDPLQNVTTYTYESTFNKVTGVTNALGKSSTYQYDVKGNMTKSIDALNNATTFTYAANGDLLTTTNAAGKLTSFTYNQYGYQTQNTDPLNHSVINTYDTIGRLISSKDGNNNTTAYEYDINGNKTKMTNAANQITTYIYDSNNNLTKVTDALGKFKIYTYDSLSRLIKETDFDNNSTNYVYDNLGNLQFVTDAKGNATKYFYNNLGQLVKERDAAGNVLTYTYDVTGNLETKTDSNANAITYSYDVLNRLLNVDYPDNNDTTYSYDKVGNVLTEENPNAKVTRTYDALNRVLSEQTIAGTVNKTIKYTYNNIGLKSTMVDGENGTTTYTYDAANRLFLIKNPKNQSTIYNYDNGNRSTRTTLANGTSMAYSYNNINQVTDIKTRNSSGVTLASNFYAYDAAGNRTRIATPEGTVNYTYDNSYRLKTATYPNGSVENYSYDSVGNRTQVINGPTTAYSYNSMNQMLTAGSQSYAYDSNGNLVNKVNGSAKTEYTYDARNALTKVTLPDNSINSYKYYPDGRRLNATDKSGNTMYFLYDGANVLTETNASGVVSSRYTSAGTDQWLSMDQGGSSYYYGVDGLGSVTGVYNQVQTAVNTYKYDSFGNVKAQTGTLANRFTYTGREMDTETGLYYYRARYYDAAAGRFTQKDPVKSVNLYAYVSNNPIILTDPSGQIAFVPILEAVGAFGVGFAGGVIYKTKNSYNQVREEANQKFKDAHPLEGDDEKDAWTHAEMSRRTTLTIGSTATKALGYGNEIAGAGRDLWYEKTIHFDRIQMDLENNRRGREAAVKGISSDELIRQDQLKVISHIPNFNPKTFGLNTINQAEPMCKTIAACFNGARDGKYAISVTKDGVEHRIVISSGGEVVIVPNPPPGSQPTTPKVTFYGDSNYGSFRFDTDVSTNQPDMGASYKSLGLPGGWSVKLKDKPLGFVGHDECFNSSQPNLEDSSGLSRNRSIDSVEVYKYNVCGQPSQPAKVTICKRTGGGENGDCREAQSDMPSMADSGFGDNELRSIYFEGNAEVVLFEHGDYNGARRTINSNQNDVGGILPFGYGTSSMMVRYKEPYRFTLYDLGDRNGASFKSDRPIINLEKWKRNGEEVETWGDAAKSIKVEPGYEAILCRDAYFRGGCVRVKGEWNYIPNIPNDVSSVQLCNNECPPAAVLHNQISPTNGSVFAPGSTIPFNWQ